MRVFTPEPIWRSAGNSYSLSRMRLVQEISDQRKSGTTDGNSLVNLFDIFCLEWRFADN